MLNGSNLIAYWKFESDGTDTSGNGNNLSATNGPSYAAGKLGNAVNLARSLSQYLSIADNASLSMGPSQSFTISAWVYPTLNGASVVCMKGTSLTTASSLEFALSFSSSRAPVFRVSSGSTVGALTGSSALTLNAWNFVVAWFDAVAKTLNISLNNGTADSASYTSGCWDSTLPLYVGSSGGASAFMDGALDAIRIDKRVWSSTEITEAYNGGSGFEQPWGNVTTSDSLSVSLTESRSIAALLSRSDSLSVGISESVSLLVSLFRVDTIGVSLAEHAAYALATLTAGEQFTPLESRLHFTIDGEPLSFSFLATQLHFTATKS